MKNFSKVIKNLERIKEAIPLMQEEFIKESLEYIRDVATNTLNNEDNLTYPTGYFNTGIQNSWEITIQNGIGTLRNTYENSASVEFGIGIVGQMSPHEQASESGYAYNMMSGKKDDNNAWDFVDEETGILFKDFQGYKGKSFMWNAFCEYKDNKQYQVIYQRLFDKYMKKLGLEEVK